NPFNDVFIANNGTIIYKDLFNKEALIAIWGDYKSKRKHLNDILNECRGQYFLVILDKNDLIVATDKFRTIPVYMSNDGGFEISNIYYLMTTDKKMEYAINKQKFAESVSTSWNYPLFTDGTIYDEINFLLPGSTYHFGRESFTYGRYYKPEESIEFGKYQDYNVLIDDLTEAIDKNYKFLENVKGIGCDITGGFDTRLNVNEVADRKDVVYANDALSSDVHLTKGRYGELKIVNKIYENVNPKSFRVENNDYQIRTWIRKNQDYLLKYNDCFVMSPKRFRYFYNRAKEKKISINLSGYSGTELCTRSPYEIKTLLLDVDEFVEKFQPYNDIMKEENYFWQYYDNLKDYIRSLAIVSYPSQPKDAYSYIIYVLIQMNSQQTYWGVANTFMPMYSPYYDLMEILFEVSPEMMDRYKIQRFLYDRIMRKELREIPTTHGFPACKVTWRNFWRFGNLITNADDYNLQFYTFFHRIRLKLQRKLVYYSPKINWFFNLVSKITGMEFRFLDRTVKHEMFDQEKLNKKFINKQLLEWILEFDKKLEKYDG
ncbi:hypothetical protein LCGC14_2169600, partial [marine sediment metagenome]